MPAPLHYRLMPVLLLPALLALAFCGFIRPAAAEPITVRSAILELNPEQPSEKTLGRLDYLGGLILAGEDSRFGGYSGLVVDADGGGLWAISDTGHWLRLEFAANEAVPTGIARAEILPLLDQAGRPVATRRDRDAEALRRTGDGRWLVAFERSHRIWTYAQPGGPASGEVALPPAAVEQPSNGGVEAIAALPGGALLLFSEELAAGEEASAAWLQSGTGWRDLAWPLRDGFRPTDAAVIPANVAGAGDVLVLERFFTLLEGPKARLRRIPAAALAIPGPLPSGVVAEWARPWSVDNMEALDVRRAADGSAWLYVMSDDNRNPLQRTLLMVFRLRP